MDAQDLLKKRLAAQGGDAEGRIINQKLKTLEAALKYSYQAETITKEGKKYRALINNNKLKMDYDDKIISIPFESKFSIGDIFYWDRTKEYWIIYLKQYSEDAYLRGFVRRAQHILKWKNSEGVICQTYGAVTGPVETKIQADIKSQINFDIPNYTCSIIVPANEQTRQLKRYDTVWIDKVMWQVTVADSITEPGVVSLHVLEYYIDKEKDLDLIFSPSIDGTSGTLENSSKIIAVKTPMDEITELEVLKPFPLWASIYIDGNKVQKDYSFTVLSGSANITNGDLTIESTDSTVTVELFIPGLSFRKAFSLAATSTPLSHTQYVIEGSKKIKSYGATTYQIRKLIDGSEDSVVNGLWTFDINKKLFTVIEQTPKSLTLQWNTGAYGTVKLSYVEDDIVQVTDDIIVQSLL